MTAVIVTPEEERAHLIAFVGGGFSALNCCESREWVTARSEAIIAAGHVVMLDVAYPDPRGSHLPPLPHRRPAVVDPSTGAPRIKWNAFNGDQEMTAMQLVAEIANTASHPLNARWTAQTV